MLWCSPRDIVALTGLAYLGSNFGMLMRFTKRSGGRWVATDWRVIPGAPNFPRLLKGGRLLISCHRGIVLNPPVGHDENGYPPRPRPEIGTINQSR